MLRTLSGAALAYLIAPRSNPNVNQSVRRQNTGRTGKRKKSLRGVSQSMVMKNEDKEDGS